jgi:hypothetical protein
VTEVDEDDELLLRGTAAGRAAICAVIILAPGSVGATLRGRRLRERERSLEGADGAGVGVELATGIGAEARSHRGEFLGHEVEHAALPAEARAGARRCPRARRATGHGAAREQALPSDVRVEADRDALILAEVKRDVAREAEREAVVAAALAPERE